MYALGKKKFFGKSVAQNMILNVIQNFSMMPFL